MRRHLYLQIYAAFVAIVVLSVAAAGAVAQLLFDGRRLPEPLAPVAELIASQIDSTDVKAGAAATGERLRLRLTLWDQGLHPLGWSDTLHRPPDPDGGSVQWLPWERGPNAAVHLADGRWLALGYRGSFDPRHFVVGLLVLVTVTSLLTWPVARRITRRLERLRGTVDRWGSGELGARAHIHGRDEVAELARGFNQAADRVQALLDAQRRLLASASHELRSPLARVRMAVEILGGDDPERAAIVADAARDVEELDALVGDLLLASRLQARPELQVRELVDLVAIADEEGARVGAQISGSCPPVVGDPRMLRRALRNLLENAARHGRGTPIEVVLASSGGAASRIEVLDRGPGVAPADAERIFEAFFRASGHHEGRDGGVGLGLSLVRDIVRHHGGEVRHAARDGGGSCFVVELPAAR